METEKQSIVVRYLPIKTMDRLHILLLDSVSQGGVSSVSISRIFSLPVKMIEKEMLVLELYGYCVSNFEGYSLSERGNEVVSVWNSFNKSEAIEIVAAKHWKLGVGEFAMPSKAKDFSAIRTRAKQIGIESSQQAFDYVEQRRKALGRHEKFISKARTEMGNATEDWLLLATEIISRLEDADHEDAISDLDALLRLHLKTADDNSGTFQNKRSMLLEQFDKSEKAKWIKNKEIAEVSSICEALLAEDWLAKSAPNFSQCFQREPAAFVFSSTVPYRSPVAKKEPAIRVSLNNPPTESEGLLRSFFRWLTG
jgi:hypothetical protein